MKNQKRYVRAFTVLEIMVALAVVFLATAISIPSYGKFRARAKKAVCISKMRQIYSAFTSAITEKGEWPQMPTDSEGNLPKWKQTDYFEFWRVTMEPYGLSNESWVCPSDSDAVQSLQAGPDELIGSYIPTWFSSGANTPFRWNQPWLVERSGFHGKGSHMVMPDGSVSETANPFGGR